MLGIDHWIAHLGAGAGVGVALAVALLLGLRHATDADHLTAVSTLVMSGHDRQPRRAAALGLAWGVGHACTVLLLGLPVVLFHRYLPEALQHALELAVGAVIVGLALRLLLRWRRGYFHVHVHSHDGTVHAHAHMHEHHGPGASHDHRHGLGRSPIASFAIGLVHGAGGSAGIGVLVVTATPGTAAATAALAIFALGTALSMTAMSTAFGYALARGPLLRRFALAAPAFGVVSVAFGVWYALAALAVLPYGM